MPPSIFSARALWPPTLGFKSLRFESLSWPRFSRMTGIQIERSRGAKVSRRPAPIESCQSAPAKMAPSRPTSGQLADNVSLPVTAGNSSPRRVVSGGGSPATVAMRLIDGGLGSLRCDSRRDWRLRLISSANRAPSNYAPTDSACSGHSLIEAGRKVAPTRLLVCSRPLPVCSSIGGQIAADMQAERFVFISRNQQAAANRCQFKLV